MIVTNYESVHKIEGKFDLIILDESHVNGSFPKPSKRTILIKKMFSSLPMVLLSGTPAVESGSQLFHQFWVSKYSPFSQYSNFYQWSKDYVDVFKIDFGNGYPSNNYSKARTDLILKQIEPYLISFTQQQAGFESEITENVLYFEPKKSTYNLAKLLLDNRFIQGNTDTIVADTPVKLMSKIHQIYNGSCIGESANTLILDHSKAKFIKTYFHGKKLAIFYYFQADLVILNKIFKDEITSDVNEFNDTYKSIAVQQSGTEGMNLSKAENIVYYNFGFSGKNYIQSRDRLTTKDRKSNEIFFIFERGGISEKIYKAICNKKDYNLKAFTKDYL